MAWFGSSLWVFAAVWSLCFWITLPVFVVMHIRNNWSHGQTGAFGYVHLLARVPVLAVIAPLGMSGQLPSQFFGSDGDAPLGQGG